MRTMASDQLNMMIRPSLACSPPHNPNLKTKINIGEDANRVHVWSTGGEQIGLPTSFRNLKVVVEILGSYMFGVQPKWQGEIYHTQNLMVCDSDVLPVCPFRNLMLELPEHETEEEEA